MSEGMCLISRESTQCQSFTFINNTRFIQLFQIPSLFSRLIKSTIRKATILFSTLRANGYERSCTIVISPVSRSQHVERTLRILENEFRERERQTFRATFHAVTEAFAFFMRCRTLAALPRFKTPRASNCIPYA